MPKVRPIVLIPVLSRLGHTDEPAWIEGAGNVSMEVAKLITADATNRQLPEHPGGLKISLAAAQLRAS